jgi:hypothetical protein
MKTKVILAVLAIVFSSTITRLQAFYLTNVANYSPYYFTDVAVGDLDNDGYEDLVCLGNSVNSINLFKGQSDGTFSFWKTVSITPVPISVAVADFNGDNKLDIIAGGYETSGNSISVLLGDGAGNFTEQTITTSQVYYNTVVADLDNDNDIDIAVPHSIDSSFSVFLNNGSAVFTETIYNYTSDEHPLFIAYGYVNNDSYPDLLVGVNNDTADSFVDVWINNQSGGFTKQTRLIIGHNPWGIDTGDFNNDGKLDMVVVNYDDDQFQVLLGNGDGTFRSPDNYQTDSGPTAIVTVDLDNDGKLDVVVAHYGSPTIQVFKGNGDGTFTFAQSLLTSDYPWMLKSSDFNNDGFKDVVVSGENGIDLYFNLGNADNLIAQSGNYTVLEDNQVTVEMNVVGTYPHFIVVNPPTKGTLSNFITNGNKLTATYTPNPDYFGSDQIKFKATNIVSSSGLATINITVTSVNDQPSFNIATTTINVYEDSPTTNILNFASNINKGAPNELSQPVRFSVVNNNNALFSVQPNLRLNGTLSFRPAPNASGSATVTAYLIDGGGTANGGIDTSAPKVFTINVINVNDPPVLRPLDKYFVSRSCLEDSDTVYNISISDIETPPDNLTLTVTSTNQTLVPNQNIQISGTGTNRVITVTPMPDGFGTTLLTFTLSDGTNSVSKSSVLRVLTVNDEPYFEFDTDTITWQNDFGRYIGAIVNMDTISTGPANESNQTWAFYVVSNTNPGLFASLPVINRYGILYFTPRKGVTGTATISVKMVDNGGVSNGGVNSYGPIDLVINIQ